MLIITRAQPRQPPSIVRANSYWVARGLTSLVIGEDLTDVGPRGLISTSGVRPSNRVAAFGRSSLFTGTQSRLFPYAASRPATRIVVIQPTSTSGTLSGPDGGQAGMQFRISAGSVQVLNAGNALLVSGGSVAANEACIVGGVLSPTVSQVWKNGQLLATASGVSIGENGSGFYIGQRGGGTEFYSGHIFLHAHFEAQLTPGEMALLTREPWQMFSPQVTYLASAVIAGTVPTLLTASAINIGTTTATAQLSFSR